VVFSKPFNLIGDFKVQDIAICKDAKASYFSKRERKSTNSTGAATFV
jgi:hypothetical protein